MPSRLTHTSCSLVRGFKQAYGQFARCIGDLVPSPYRLGVIWEAELPTSWDIDCVAILQQPHCYIGSHESFPRMDRVGARMAQSVSARPLCKRFQV